MGRARTSKKATALATQAMQLYWEGKLGEAIATWETLLALPKLTPEADLDARFWLGCALHNRGDLERAAELLDPICFDPEAVRVSRTTVYKIATRSGFVAIERGLPLASIEPLMERIQELSDAGEDGPRCRQLIVRGSFELARGRRAAGLRLVERGFDARQVNGASLADTPYLRRLVPGSLRRGQTERARELLDIWEVSGDPEAFKRPHLEAFTSDWHLQQGDPESALRWALLARERSRGSEDLAGRTDAARSLCLASLRMGLLAVCRGEVRQLLALRRRAGPEDRLDIELTAVEAYAGMARLHTQCPLVDLDTGDEQSSRDSSEAPSAEKAAACLRRAEQACGRAGVIAEALDVNMHSRHRRRAVARRRRRLQELLPSGSGTSEMSPPSRAKAAIAPTDSRGLPEPPELPVVLESDSAGSRLTLPVRGLKKVLSAAAKRSRDEFVLQPVKPRESLRVDVWRLRRLLYSFEVDLERMRGGLWCTLRIEESPAPPWLEQIADAARRHHADRLRRSGERALARGNGERAARDFDAARPLAEGRWEYWECSARSRIALGRPDEAFDFCLQALELDSTEHQAWCSLADILEVQERLPEAHRALQQALARTQEDGSVAAELVARVEALDARLDPRQIALPLA